MPWAKGDPNHPRRGNGSKGLGWGGAAKGEGKPPGNLEGGRPMGVKDGEGKRAQARAALEDAAPLAVQTVIEIAKDRGDQRALQAAVHILDRIGLHVKSGIEVTGSDGAPMEIVVRILDEVDAATGPDDPAAVSPANPD